MWIHLNTQCIYSNKTVQMTFSRKKKAIKGESKSEEVENKYD